MKLAETPRLGTLVAEHGPHVEELVNGRLRLEGLLDISADDSGCSLGPHRDGPPVAVREGVHLLLDDVGHLPIDREKTSVNSRMGVRISAYP